MYCSNCGVSVTGAKFCSACGTAAAPPPTLSALETGGQISPDLHPSTTNFGSLLPPATQPQMVSFGQAISAGFRGYVVWNARSTRAEYWWWTLFNVLVLGGALLIDSVATGGLLYLLGVVGLFLPNLSVLIRRLHDLDRSGGWFWISLVPLAGGIVLLVFVLTPSKPGPNRWDRSLVVGQ